MHGTFPERFPMRAPLPEAVDPWMDLGISLAFASIPLALAIVTAILCFGSNVTFTNVVDILVTASSAAPM
jgi:hypothetical protein